MVRSGHWAWSYHVCGLCGLLWALTKRSVPPQLIFPCNVLSLIKLKPFNSPIALPLHLYFLRIKNHLFFSTGRDNMYVFNVLFDLLPSCRKCSSMQVQEMCLCVWSSLECVTAEQRLGNSCGTAVPMVTCQHRQPHLWWWRQNSGFLCSAEGLLNLTSWKVVEQTPGDVCSSPFAPYSRHSAVCRIGLLLAGEKKPHLNRISVCAKGLLENGRS